MLKLGAVVPLAQPCSTSTYNSNSFSGPGRAKAGALINLSCNVLEFCFPSGVCTTTQGLSWVKKSQNKKSLIHFQQYPLHPKDCHSSSSLLAKGTSKSSWTPSEPSHFQVFSQNRPQTFSLFLHHLCLPFRHSEPPSQPEK